MNELELYTISTKLQEIASNSSFGWEINNVARNILLDCQDLTFDEHPDNKICGNRIAQSRKVKKEDFNYQNKFSIHRFLDTVIGCLAEDGNDKDVLYQTEGNELDVVRVVSYYDFFTYWLGAKSNNDKSEIKEIVNNFFENEKIHIPKVTKTSGSSFTFVNIGGFIDTIKTIEDNKKAYYVQKKLALPGFHNKNAYKEKIGLLAIRYTLPTDELYAPSIKHAGTTPNFSPGYISENVGHTEPHLKDDGIAPWTRNQTIKKENKPLELVHRSRLMSTLDNHQIINIGLFVDHI